MAFDDAYAALCDTLPVVPGMNRGNMQPLMEGGYPDADTWVEQFASYPELHRDGIALVLKPARMTPPEHSASSSAQAEKCRVNDAWATVDFSMMACGPVLLNRLG